MIRSTQQLIFPNSKANQQKTTFGTIPNGINSQAKCLHHLTRSLLEQAESNEVASADESYLLELNQLEFFDPTQLISEEAVIFDGSQLAMQEIAIEGWDTITKVDDSVDTANFTAASLLMLFTTREDKRRKLKANHSVEQERNCSPRQLTTPEFGIDDDPIEVIVLARFARI